MFKKWLPSYDIIWYHMMSYDIIWYHMISCDIISYDNIWCDDIRYIFLTCSGHVPKKFGGSKMKFFQKVLGTLGYALASSLVSKSRSKNQKSLLFFKKMKCFSEAPESYLKSFALNIKFIALFSHWFMHFFIFNIFRIFPFNRAPKGLPM